MREAVPERRQRLCVEYATTVTQGKAFDSAGFNFGQGQQATPDAAGRATFEQYMAAIGE